MTGRAPPSFERWRLGLDDWWNYKEPAMAKNQQTQKKSGLTAPGYNYLGPGNSLDNGEPVNTLDAAAKKHDHGYDAKLKSGDNNPYVHFNDADVEMMSDINKHIDSMPLKERLLANAVNGVWALKKNVMPHDIHPANKETNEPTSSETVVSDHEMAEASNKRGIDEVSMDAGEGPSSKQARTGGAAAGNDMGGGVMGTKVPPTYWGCSWKGKTVSTSRYDRIQFSNEVPGTVLPYKVTDGGGGTYKILSDWKMLDYNRMWAHFPPKDLQYLYRNCARWRPVGIKVTYHSMQCTQETEIGGTKSTQLVPLGLCQVAVRRFGEIPYRMNGKKLAKDGTGKYDYPYHSEGLTQLQNYMYVQKNPTGVLTAGELTFLVEHGKIEYMGSTDNFTVATKLDAEWVYNYENWGHVTDIGIDVSNEVAAGDIDFCFANRARLQNFTVQRCVKNNADHVWVTHDGPTAGEEYNPTRQDADLNISQALSAADNPAVSRHTTSEVTLTRQKKESDPSKQVWTVPATDAPRVIDGKMLCAATDPPIWVLRPHGLNFSKGAFMTGGHMLKPGSDVPPMVLFRCRPMFGKNGTEVNMSCNMIMQVETLWEVEFLHGKHSGMGGHGVMDIGDGGIDYAQSSSHQGLIWKKQAVPNLLDKQWPGPYKLRN